ncbi:hypothetical protein PoB_006399400 [Plakobranchus ocellatus]|uniref:Uncharacterized protein n=1 Tax=Plakobranchus ocellatus TaxID=259542 RepID=A0AAV4D0A1_9GAST|nr:hypothetical protein PoB_006399400 [Plakobranchus ocellatus]
MQPFFRLGPLTTPLRHVPGFQTSLKSHVIVLFAADKLTHQCTTCDIKLSGPPAAQAMSTQLESALEKPMQNAKWFKMGKKNLSREEQLHLGNDEFPYNGTNFEDSTTDMVNRRRKSGEGCHDLCDKVYGCYKKSPPGNSSCILDLVLESNIDDNIKSYLKSFFVNGEPWLIWQGSWLPIKGPGFESQSGPNNVFIAPL